MKMNAKIVVISLAEKQYIVLYTPMEKSRIIAVIGSKKT